MIFTNSRIAILSLATFAAATSSVLEGTEQLYATEGTCKNPDGPDVPTATAKRLGDPSKTTASKATNDDGATSKDHQETRSDALQDKLERALLVFIFLFFQRQNNDVPFKQQQEEEKPACGGNLSPEEIEAIRKMISSEDLVMPLVVAITAFSTLTLTLTLLATQRNREPQVVHNNIHITIINKVDNTENNLHGENDNDSQATYEDDIEQQQAPVGNNPEEQEYIPTVPAVPIPFEEPTANLVGVEEDGVLQMAQVVGTGEYHLIDATGVLPQ